MEVKSTADYTERGLKILVYGESGSGKTFMIPTLPNPVVFSAEGGLRSIAGHDIPYIDIKSVADLDAAWDWLIKSKEAQQYQSLAIDSITEIGEIVLREALAKNSHGQAAYGELGQTMLVWFRRFRDLDGWNVYLIAQIDRIQDETGKLLFGPAMPGKMLTGKIPYIFDTVGAMHVNRDAKTGEVERYIQFEQDQSYIAKNRGDFLDAAEWPDLGEIVRKSRGGD